MVIQILRQVNILHIRALVKADAVILFDTYGSADSRLHSVFLYHLEVSRHYCTARASSLIPLISTISRLRAQDHHMSFGHCISFSLLIHWTYLWFQCARINTSLGSECFRSGDGLHPKSGRRSPRGDGR